MYFDCLVSNVFFFVANWYSKIRAWRCFQVRRQPWGAFMGMKLIGSVV